MTRAPVLKSTYPHLPLYLAGRPRQTERRLAVHDKFTGEIAASVAEGDPALLNEAIGRAADAARCCAEWPAHARRDALTSIGARLAAERPRFTETLVTEVGKTRAEASAEVERAVDTFRLAAEEATRIGGEVLPLDISPRGAAYQGYWRRFPVGAAGLITPFNFPLNLAAHKVAPAIAAGCPFVLKPATRTPLTTLMLGELIADAGLPPGAFSIVPCPASAATALATDPRIALFSFTGSPAVGWDLRARAGQKRVSLELGGNAACVVEPGVDLDFVTERIVAGAFGQAGQSCISVQRVLAHASVFEALVSQLSAAATGLRVGDPHDDRTGVGPLISTAEAERVGVWVNEALAAGATARCGGRRDGALYAPTVLTGVPSTCRVWAQEVFGPVVCVAPYEDFEAALDAVNDSAFGLQAGVFTHDLDRALRAHERLHVGGVIIGDIPSVRVDNMPYGGVKRSGAGREGVRFAIEEMTEHRMLMIRRR